ncbi:MAG: Flp pilus assembly complex ATPase component TadA [Bdellovibrionales bacterium]|nr:Flp pilus assembly complex ATPase component TadA [Bdellovibrionales bacterium]
MNNEYFIKTFKQVFIQEFQKGRLCTFGEISEMITEDQNYQCLQTKTWYQNIINLSFLDQFIRDDQVTEIITHNNTTVQTEIDHQLEFKTIENISPEDYQLSLEVLTHINNISWNYSTSFASFTLQRGQRNFRVSLLHFSITPGEKSKAFIRRINKNTFYLNNYQLPNETERFLQESIKNKKNIIISGSTGSGKTTLLSSLIKQVSKVEHLIVIEDTNEISISSNNITHIEVGDNKKLLLQSCANALRMRPDRIILGEVRSSEVIPFIMAMNTGHKGLMGSIHANSAYDSLARLAVLFSIYHEGTNIDFEIIMKLICQNIDLIVHMENHKITQIIQVLGSESGSPFHEIIYEHVI